MANIKRGDQVVVLTGKDKGKKGKVLSVDAEKGMVVVEGVNIVIKHKKARSAQQKSSREKRPHHIHISNVQILCKCGKQTRVAHQFIDGKKARTCAKCNEVLDKKYVRAAKKAEKVEDKEEGSEDKKDKKPLQRREVKSTADVKVKAPVNTSKQMNLPRKVGGS